MSESYITVMCIKCGKQEALEDPDQAGTYYNYGYTRVCCGMDMQPVKYMGGGACAQVLEVLEHKGFKQTDIECPDIWDYYQDREGR